MPRPPSRRSATAGSMATLGLVAALIPLVNARPAAALDPQRPLSQALLRIWQVQQGLPRGVIFSIRQTSDGYLWLGTQTGLYRFDGVRFVPWESDTRLPPNLWVQDLAEDRDGRLWAATEGAGVIRITRDAVTVFGTNEGLPSDRVRCLRVDRHGTLWAGTDRGLARFVDNRFQPVGLGDRAIRALAEADDGTLWVATDGPALYRQRDTTFEAHPLNSLPERATINALAVDPTGTLWVGTTAGLLRKSGADERLVTTADGLGNDLVLSLTPTGDHDLWVGTKDGLCRLQGDRVERFQAREGLSQSTVHAICEDHEGSVWVGTKHGLNQLIDRRTLFPFTTAEGLPSNDTGPLLQGRDGTIWVGTLGAGLARFDGRRFASVATAENGLPSDRVLALADGGHGELWVGTDRGLAHYDGQKISSTWTKDAGLPSDTITCLAGDADGSLWVGTAGGLVRLDDGRIEPVNGEAATEPVRAMAPEPGGSMVVALGTRLYRLDGGTLAPLPDQQQFGEAVDAFHRDPEGRLWAAVRGRGLGLVGVERRHEFGVRDGLFDDDIFGITSDDKGRLWMGCSRGVFSVPRDELMKFADGTLDRLTATPFSPTDALRTLESQEGVQPSIWKMDDGRVWLSTIRGIIVVAPERVGRPLPPPAVLLEEVRVDGQAVSRDRLLHVPPGRTNIDFRYTALSLAWPTRLSFRYRLEGFDDDWVDAGTRREAFYTNLPPGRYRFRVAATTADGTTAEAASPVEFTLDPHFYQTRWFWPALVVLLTGLGWLAYRLRIRQMKARWRAVLAERNRIARELHDTLIQGFSGVTMQMQAVAARLRHSAEFGTLTDIIRDAGQCLSEARRSVAGLRNPRPGESGLAEAIARTARQLADPGDARLVLRLAPVTTSLNPDVEYNLVRIVQEAVANAVKHAAAGEIEVTMATRDGALRLTVRDDGVGFDAEDYFGQPRPGHYGLIGMRERAAQIGAAITWESESPLGTTVTITRPLPHAAPDRAAVAAEEVR